MHVHFHFDHNHDGPFSRLTRDLGGTLDWVTGPAMSQQERMELTLAEVQNEMRGYGVI